MALSVKLKPVEETHFMVESDASHETTVTFVQVTTGDAQKLDDLFGEQTQTYDRNNVSSGSVSIKRRWNFPQLARERVFYTMTGCNIERIIEKVVGGETTQITEPYFNFKADKNGTPRPSPRQDFYSAWDSLPQSITDELYDLCIQTNIQWINGQDDEAGE